MNHDIHKRTIALIGEKAHKKIQKSTVCVFGAGGVGSFAIESLARVGIGCLVIVDHATVDLTNINRQLIALHSTVGQYKTQVFKERIKDINPDVCVITHESFVQQDNIKDLVPKKCDYIIDAIDTIESKIALIHYAKKNSIPIISCMGMGKKLDPGKFMITDIEKTKICPLAKKIRIQLRKEGIKNVDVLFSTEIPQKSDASYVTSISFVPATAGLLLTGHVINKIIERDE